MQRFQDVEEAHLKQMKEFIMTYIEIVQNNHSMIGQVREKKKVLKYSVTFIANSIPTGSVRVSEEFSRLNG